MFLDMLHRTGKHTRGLRRSAISSQCLANSPVFAAGASMSKQAASYLEYAMTSLDCGLQA